jgi:hypothetical protein
MNFSLGKKPNIKTKLSLEHFKIFLAPGLETASCQWQKGRPENIRNGR